MIGHDGTDRVALAVIGLLTEEDEVRVLTLDDLGEGVAGGADVGAGEGVVGQVDRTVSTERDGLLQGALADSGPIVTATISSTSTTPPSRSCMAASMAWVSYGLRFFSPLRSMRPVDGSMRFWTAASGTSFTNTAIFTVIDAP